MPNGDHIPPVSHALSHASYACEHLYKGMERSQEGNPTRGELIKSINQDRTFTKCRLSKLKSKSSSQSLAGSIILVIEHCKFGKILYSQYNKACYHHILLLLESYTITISCSYSSLSLLVTNSPHIKPTVRRIEHKLYDTVRWTW